MRKTVLLFVYSMLEVCSTSFYPHLESLIKGNFTTGKKTKKLHLCG